MRSSVAAAWSSVRRAAGANANSSPATSASALPRHCLRAARSRLAASRASPLASAWLPARACDSKAMTSTAAGGTASR